MGLRKEVCFKALHKAIAKNTSVWMERSGTVEGGIRRGFTLHLKPQGLFWEQSPVFCESYTLPFVITSHPHSQASPSKILTTNKAVCKERNNGKTSIKVYSGSNQIFIFPATFSSGISIKSNTSMKFVSRLM